MSIGRTLTFTPSLALSFRSSIPVNFLLPRSPGIYNGGLWLHLSPKIFIHQVICFYGNMPYSWIVFARSIAYVLLLKV